MPRAQAWQTNTCSSARWEHACLRIHNTILSLSLSGDVANRISTQHEAATFCHTQIVQHAVRKHCHAKANASGSVCCAALCASHEPRVQHHAAASRGTCAAPPHPAWCLLRQARLRLASTPCRRHGSCGRDQRAGLRRQHGLRACALCRALFLLSEPCAHRLPHATCTHAFLH